MLVTINSLSLMPINVSASSANNNESNQIKTASFFALLDPSDTYKGNRENTILM